MSEFIAEAHNDQVLVESTSFDYIHGPIRKTTRLKYKCSAVSNGLVALGSNTGGIYLFSRSEEKLLQIAFAEKETNSVVSLQLSPNEKFVGFVSGQGIIYVLELKLGTNAKSETLRSTSELAGSRITCLHWDPSSTKLYIGDDGGKVSVMPVSSSKAKNLFSQEIEVIMKLDSPVVQIDKAEQHVLVSTTTKVYLCDTIKLNYRSVGKKLRDGPYGACFLNQDSETSMIYCARPGSRIWEVDCNGSVLNTHQFKQLILGVPPSDVVSTTGDFQGLQKARYDGELANFSKLKVLCGNFLLTWSSEVIYVLDPVNVKVILWANHFKGIVDVTCIGNQIYIFQETMEITHVALLPVSEVVPLCLSVPNITTAARLCIAYRNILHHKHVRKKLSVADLYTLHDKLLSLELNEVGEQLKAVILEVEGKISLESDSDSNRSRSSSIISNLEHSEDNSSKSRKVDAYQSSEHHGIYSLVDNSDRKETKSDDTGTQNYDTIDGEIFTRHNSLGTPRTYGTNYIQNSETDMKEQISTNSSENEPVEKSFGKEENGLQACTTNTEDRNSVITADPSVDIDESTNPEESNKEMSNMSMPLTDDTSVSMATEDDAQTVTIATDGRLEQEEYGEDDMRVSSLGSRRPSLTSLSSLSSAEVFLDQKQNATMSTTDDPIAVPVKRKPGKKRRTRKSSGEPSDSPLKEGLAIRRKSTGSFPFQMDRTAMMSPTGSLHEETIEERQDTDNLLPDTDFLINKGKHSATKTPDSLSIGSPLSNSGEFELSGREMSRSGEFSQSNDTFLPDSPLQETTDKNAAAKIKLKKMKEKMQTTVTSKTKNLIRNIKEKNLLTKAKVLAENLSQVSENNKFLFGDGPYIDSVDFHATKTRPEEQLHEHDEVHEGATDNDMGRAESVVDLEQLQTVTEHTMAKLNSVEVLLNPDVLQKALTDWVTVINETFYKLHMKLFMPCSLGEETDTVSTVNKIVDSTVLENEEAVSKSSERDQVILDSAWNYGASILCDKDFGYCKDPLGLPASLYNHVCQLAQVCFDTKIHGNILSYRFGTSCKEQREPHVPFHVDGRTNISSLSSQADCDTTPPHPTDLCDNATVDTDNTQSEYTNKHNQLNTSYDEIEDTVEFANECKDELQTLGNDKGMQNSHGVNIESNITGTEHEIADTGTMPSKHRANSNAERNREDCQANKDGSVLTVENQESTSAVDSRDSDKEAIAFYMRCYFPYLSLSKVQERLQTEKDTFELWCAFVACLQGYVVNDSERLGIQKSNVIGHLIDTHYHSDNSSLLLGHVSRLFLKWDASAVSSVVNTCVKCFPYIQPIDVLFLCKLYSVELDTIFQQYMSVLCDQLSKSHRSDKDVPETDLHRHIEVKCAWLEVLLAEEGNQAVVMDTECKPRKGSHKLRWRNEYYIENILSSPELAEDDSHRILNICYQYGYWPGVLRLTKHMCIHEEHLQTILYLGDVELISAEHKLGYLPPTGAAWEHLFTQVLAQRSADREPDEETSLSLDNLCQIMLKHIGPERTLALLDKLVPGRAVSAELYQSCLLTGLVQKRQRSVLHTMLEAVDSYLWSQRPNEASPQLNMCLMQGKYGQTDMEANAEVLQQLRETDTSQPFIEDSDCHWGVEARNSLRCCSCNNLLRATVSLEQSGVLIFRCGHGYHVMCLPEEQCLMCHEQD